MLFLPAASADSTSTLTSPNAQNFGWFGSSVAINENDPIVVVGASLENTNAVPKAGHAYVLDTTTGLITTLTSPTPQSTVFDRGFGFSVSISGTTVVVGAPEETANALSGAGHAYVFDATTGSLITTLTSPNAQISGMFGDSVSISGTTVVVGAPDETANALPFAGHAYVFDASTGSPIASLTSPSAQGGGLFGISVSVGCTSVVVGASEETANGQQVAGHAYSFDATAGFLATTLTSPNVQVGGEFGTSVAVSGRTVVVGALFETGSGFTQAGHAYIFP